LKVLKEYLLLFLEFAKREDYLSAGSWGLFKAMFL
jgi:hypothetical protein